MVSRFSRWLTLLLIVVFLTAHSVEARQSIKDQSLEQADSLRSAGQLDLALEAYNSIISKTEVDTLISLALVGKALTLFSQGDAGESAKIFQEALTQQLAYLNSNSYKLLRTYAMLGYLNRYFLEEERLAIDYYRKEYEIISDHPDRATERQKFYSNYNLATTYRLIEDFEMALNHAFQGLEIATTADNNQYLEFSYSVIANLYNVLGEEVKAIPYYEKKINLNLRMNGEGHPTLINDYNNLGVVYSDISEFKKAEELFRKSLNISLINQADNNEISNTHLLLGKVIGLNGHLQSGLQYMRKALKLKNSDLEQSRVLSHMAQLYEHFDKLDSSLIYYQRALLLEGHDIYEQPSQALIQRTPFLFRILSYKAGAMLSKYHKRQDVKALESARESYRLMGKLASYYRNYFNTEEARLFFREYTHAHNEKALESIYLMFQRTNDFNLIDEAWEIFEKSKALSLFESVKRAQKFTDLGINDSIVQSEQHFIQEISNLRNQMNACELASNCEESEISKIRGQLLENENAHNTLKDVLKRDFPNYFNTHYNSESASISDIQANLGESLMISYFQGEKTIFWISVEQDKKRFGRIVLDQEFIEQHNHFVEEVRGSRLQSKSLSQSFRDYQDASHYLYQSLLEPILSETQHTSLIILPDGILSELTFEAFTKTKATEASNYDYKGLDYLIRSYEISYAYSASLCMEQRQTPTISNPQLIAFGDPDNSAFHNLPGTAIELDVLSQFGSTRIFKQSEASEDAFAKITQNDVDILHMALHAKADTLNPMNSGFVLSNQADSNGDGIMHLYELYGMLIPAKLVVLTACETGVGQWKRGEGILSLSRGFIYNDNPNLIMSLWKVNDQQSAKMMESFYTAIYSGTSTGKALKTAKLRFLETADELTAHPSNWAGLVYLGDSDFRIDITSFSNAKLIYWSLTALLIIIVGFKKNWSLRRETNP